MGNISISAVVNCYNEEIWIESSIRSLIGLVDEIVVYDNCSTDKTGEIVENIIRELENKSIIKYIRAEEPKQLADARNIAMDIATGDWILKWDGDFVAYVKPKKHDIVKGMDKIIDRIRENEFTDFDIILLHSINVSGDVFHYDLRRKYLGLHGDSFIIKKGRVKYVSDEKYPDTGIIRGSDGGPAKMYRINKPGDPIYYLHMFGVKDDSYHLYRAFMVDYQKSITSGFEGSFEDWYEKNKSVDKEDAEKYVRRQMMDNLIPHKLPLPSIVAKSHDLVGLFSLEYEYGLPKSRKTFPNARENISSSDEKLKINRTIDKWLTNSDEGLNSISISEINAQLSNKYFLKNFLKRICEQDSTFHLNNVPSMLLSLSICTITNNAPLEIFYLRKIIDKNKSKDIRVRDWINLRIDNLLMNIGDFSDRNRSVESKVCLLVAGQLRNFEYSMKSWKQYFEGISVDCFVSTWDTIGYKKWDNFNLPGDLVRIVDSKTYELVIDNSVDGILDKIRYEYEKNHPNKSVLEIKRSLEEILSWTDNLDVQIIEEGKNEYLDYTNDEKYYFHNSNAGKQVPDISKYDAVIKIRPDLILHDNDNRFIQEIPKIIDGGILTERNFTVASWGFGIGDQIVAASPKYLRELFIKEKLSTSTHDLCRFINRPKYSFHTTIGLAAWINGLRFIDFNKYTRMGIFQDDLISMG